MICSPKQRGFVTMATGDEKYYQFARNLLYSYRLHNKKLPFGIICDRENEYTRDFDDVVVIENPTFTYSDKFRVFVDSPYEETVFIESDCLVYRNLDEMFELLAGGDDYTAFGVNDDNIKVWFSKPEQLRGTFGDMFTSIPVFNPGYLFIRKSPLTEKIYADTAFVAGWLVENRPDDGKISLFTKGMLRDDVVFSMVMKRNGCRCVAHPSVGKCIFYPNTKRIIKINVISGELNVVQDKEYKHCNLLHFSSRKCMDEGLYLQQSMMLNMHQKHCPKWIVKWTGLKATYLKYNFFRKARNRIKELLSVNG